MSKDLLKSNKNTSTESKFKVVKDSQGNLEVSFPFSEVPIKMTQEYFDKNIDIEKYIIDLKDEDIV